MAVSITDNVTTQNDLDTSATFSTIGGGPGASILSAMRYQGTAAGARRINSANTDFGFWVTGETPTRNINTAGLEVFWYKGFVKQRGDLNANGLRLRLGSATSAYYEWTTGDDGTIVQPQFEYPIPGGFVVIPVYVGLRAWHDVARTGSPDVTAIDEYAVTVNVSATANGEDLALDALQYSIDGLFMTGGTPDGTFQDFLDADEGEGSATADRVGMWQSKAGVFIVYAKHVIGRDNGATVTATQFTDSFATIVFPGGKTDEGFNGFEWDLGNASTTVSLTNCSLTGNGRSRKKWYFDTEFDVTGGATDTINLPSHGLITGDQVQYSAESGTEDIGPDATNGEGALVTGTSIPTGDRWYVIVSDSDTIQLASTMANALAGTATDLTPSAAGNGENHSLVRTPDTRPDFEFTGTAGDADITDCTFTGFNAFILRSVVTFTGCTITASRSLAVNGGTITNCTISHDTYIGEPFMTMSTSADIANITGTNFTNANNLGHAIEVTSTATTVTATDLTFTGYGPDLVSFNALNDVDDTNDEIDIIAHGFSTGDPIFYVASDPSTGSVGTAISGLTSENLYYIEAVTVDSISLHPSAASANLGASGNTIAISTGSDEVHQICSANAAFFNSTGGDITIDVSGGSTISVRNSSGSTTTVNAGVTITITVLDSDQNAIQNAAVYVQDAAGPFDNDNEIIRELTNASGVASGTYDGTTPLTVTLRVRKKGFIPVNQTQQITASGLTVTVSMVNDSNIE